VDDAIVFGIFKKHLPDMKYFRDLILIFKNQKANE